MTHARGTQLFYGPVHAVLGLLGLVAFILCVTAFAAAVTYVVVRVSPNPANKREAS